ncbi:response regulator transcription factor [Calditrichota bacterium GD2]
MEKIIKILIIEDDPVICEFLKTGLGYERYQVSICNKGENGLAEIRHNAFDLVILDVMLPDVDGFTVCRNIRELGLSVPVLMLTIKSDVTDRVKGLDSGADDYLTKPFSFDELLARIRALLRRSGKIPKSKILQAGNIHLNIETREVYVSDRRIELTPTEFSLLELFLRHPCRVFTRDTLLNRVLGYNYNGGTNIIDVHVSHLRKKLGDKNGNLIKTIYGVGYSFSTENL